MKNDPLNSVFGATLARLRKERGWTQEEFGFECSLSRQFVSQLERGISSPSLSTISQLAGGLKVTEEHLVKLVFDKVRASADASPGAGD